jgi:hypothetical protein
MPDRYCPVCSQVDDHPRHQIAGTVDNVAPHMDCCAQVGCPDGTCDVLVRNKGKKTGDAFRSLIADEHKETRQLLDTKARRLMRGDVDPAVHGGFVAGPIELRGADR